MSIPANGLGQWSAAIAGHREITERVVRLDPTIFHSTHEEGDRGPRFLALWGNGARGRRGNRAHWGTAVFGRFLSSHEAYAGEGLVRVERFEAVDVEPELGDDGEALLREWRAGGGS